MTEQTIRIAIADDHPIVIDGLEAIFQAVSHVEVVLRASNGKDLLQQIPDKAVDIVLLDVQMPEMDGAETCRQLKQHYPDMRVLMLTMSKEAALIRETIEAGAQGYVLKNTGKQELLDAMKTIITGGTWYSKEVGQVLLDSMHQQAKAPIAPKPKVQLTKREKDILSLIMEERTTQEIADALFISQNTVETHRKNLMSKLGARNLAGLVRYAIEQGLLDE